jgi:hypothetical protein
MPEGSSFVSGVETTAKKSLRRFSSYSLIDVSKGETLFIPQCFFHCHVVKMTAKGVNV